MYQGSWKQPKNRGQGKPEDRIGQGETRGEGIISVRADEMSMRMLELTKDIVKNLIERTQGTMVVSTDKFEILVLRDQHAKFKTGMEGIFNMILEMGAQPDRNKNRDTKTNLEKNTRREWR